MTDLLNSIRAFGRTAIVAAMLVGLTTGNLGAIDPISAIHESKVTRRLLASSAEESIEIYQILATEYFDETKLFLARNTALPEEIYLRLSEDPDVEISITLISNQGMEIKKRETLVERFLNSASPKDRYRLLHTRMAPAWFLEECANDLDPAIRARVVGNSRVSQEILLKLANDPFGGVASASRWRLKSEYPDTFSAQQTNWIPIEELSSRRNLADIFAEANSASDWSKVDEIIAYYQRTEVPLYRLAQAIFPAFMEERFDPTVVNKLLAQGMSPTSISNYAGLCGNHPEWLAYFKETGALEGRGSTWALNKALESEGSVQHITALLEIGVDPDTPDSSDSDKTLLHRSVVAGNLQVMGVLLDHGANPHREDSYNHKSPLDLAVMLNFMDAIKLLDTENEHADLLAEFSRDFPPVNKSPIVGRWQNMRDGFNQFVIHLEPSGSGRIVAVARMIPIGWRVTSKYSAEIIALPPGDLGQQLKMGDVEWSRREGNLIFSKPNGEEEKLQKLAF